MKVINESAGCVQSLYKNNLKAFSPDWILPISGKKIHEDIISRMRGAVPEIWSSEFSRHFSQLSKTGFLSEKILLSPR